MTPKNLFDPDRMAKNAFLQNVDLLLKKIRGKKRRKWKTSFEYLNFDMKRKITHNLR